MAQPVSERDDVRYTVAHGLLLVLLLGVAISVPWALVSVIQDIHTQENPLYFVTNRATASGADFRLYLDLTRLNDSERTIAMQATAQRRCVPACPDTVQLTLYTALSPIGNPDEWLPVTTALTFPPGRDTISQSVQWPVYGDALRYPFDWWSFGVLVIPQRPLASGALETLPPTQGRDQLAISLQSHIPRLNMTPDPDRAPSVAIASKLLGVPPDQVPPTLTLFILKRPLYLQVLTVLLVLLVTAAAAYTVFLRSLDQLLGNAGVLVLGIWGIRAILLGTGLTVLTLVDLALMAVILFLLVIITARVLWLVEPKSGLHKLRMPWHRTARVEPAAVASPPDVDRKAGREGGTPP